MIKIVGEQEFNARQIYDHHMIVTLSSEFTGHKTIVRPHPPLIHDKIPYVDHPVGRFAWAFQLEADWQWIVTSLWASHRHASIKFEYNSHAQRFAGPLLVNGFQPLNPLIMRMGLRAVWAFDDGATLGAEDTKFVLGGFFYWSR